MARLRERENLLKSRLQEQERLLHRLQQQDQAVDQHTAILDRNQDTLHAGQFIVANQKKLINNEMKVEKSEN